MRSARTACLYLGLCGCHPEPDCYYTEYAAVTRSVTIASARDLGALEGRCIFVRGSLHFEDPSARDLSGLEGIIGVSGNVVIADAHALETTAGLDNLEFIGGDLRITNDLALGELDIPALAGVGGTVELATLPAVDSLAGIEQLDDVGRDLLAHGLPSLREWDLASIERVGDDLMILDNDALERIVMTDALFEVGGSILITGNGTLSTIDGFAGLDRVGGDIYLDGRGSDSDDYDECPDGHRPAPGTAGGFFAAFNPRLQRVAGFERIHRLGATSSRCSAVGWFGVWSNPDLVELHALPNLESTTLLDIADNAALGSLPPWSAMEVGQLQLANQPGWTDLRALEGATIMDAWISDNPDLRSLDGLRMFPDALALHVASNPMLERLGAPSIQSLSSLLIDVNPSLTDVEPLRTVDGIHYVYVVRNASLDQLYVEDVLAHVDAFLEKIAGNAGWMPPAECPWPSDGICDESDELGPALCRPGTDEVDCAS